MKTSSAATCPRCQREISTYGHRFSVHSPTPGSNDYCPMSNQREHIAGLDAVAYYSRALLVGDLATQLHDEDPRTVWDYLETLSGWELQRIAMVAIAGFDVDRTINDAFSWLATGPQRIRRTA